jgi:hypothetical protein
MDNFYESRLNGYRVIKIFLIILRRVLFFCFQSVIWILWSKKISKRSLSNVVQQVWKYLYIDFHETGLNGYGVMDFFVIVLNHVLCFFTLKA